MVRAKLDKKSLFLLVLILFGAFSVRLYFAGKSTGIDWMEAGSLTAARSLSRGIFSDVFPKIFVNEHMPLDFILRAGWGTLFGFSEQSQVALSLIFGLGSIIVLFMLGKQLFNAKLGLLAAIFMALNATHIYFSINTRMYALLMFLTTLSIYFYTKDGLSYRLAICNTLLLMTHVFAVLPLLSIMVDYLIVNKLSLKKMIRAKKKIMLTFGIPLILYFAYLAFIIYFWNRNLLGWVTPLSLAGISGLLHELASGSTAQTNMTVALTVLFGLIMMYSARYYHEMRLIWLVILSILIPAVFSLIFSPVLYIRSLLYLLPAVMILIGYTIMKQSRIVAASLLTLLMMLSLANLDHYDTVYRKDSITDAVDYLSPIIGNNTIIHTDLGNVNQYRYYFDSNVKILPIFTWNGDPSMRLESIKFTSDKIFVSVPAHLKDGSAERAFCNNITGFMNAHYKLQSIHTFTNVIVYEYLS